MLKFLLGYAWTLKASVPFLAFSFSLTNFSAFSPRKLHSEKENGNSLVHCNNNFLKKSHQLSTARNPQNCYGLEMREIRKTSTYAMHVGELR